MKTSSLHHTPYFFRVFYLEKKVQWLLNLSPFLPYFATSFNLFNVLVKNGEIYQKVVAFTKVCKHHCYKCTIKHTGFFFS